MTEKIEIILDRCLEEISRGRDHRDVLEEYRGHPEYSDLKDAVQMALELRKLEAPPASRIPDLSVFAADSARKPKAAGRTIAFRLITRIAAVFALTLILLGVAVQASDDSIPGDLLYPVKRGYEKVRLACSIGCRCKAEYRMKCSRKRMDEALAVLKKGGKADLSLFDTMFDDLRYALEKALSLSENERAELLLLAAGAMKEQKDGLCHIYQVAPESEKPGISHYVCACARRNELLANTFGMNVPAASVEDGSGTCECGDCKTGLECGISAKEISATKEILQSSGHNKKIQE